MKNKLFSIIIPAYNRENVLERTVKSALAQTYEETEIIIVDDGSTDKTLDVANDIAKRYANVLVLSQPNGRACNARNNGAKISHGDYLLFLDSDDEILPDFLKEAVAIFDEKPNVGLVYCQTGIIKGGQLVKARKDTVSGDNVYKEVLEQGFLTSSSFCCVRRFAFDAIGGWNEHAISSQDDDFCFKIAKQFGVSLIDKILGIYNADSNNTMSSNRYNLAEGWYRLWENFEDDVVEYCGESTMARHYYETARWFVFANDIDGINKSLNKCKEYASDKCYKYYNRQIRIYRIERGLKDSRPAMHMKNIRDCIKRGTN